MSVANRIEEIMSREGLSPYSLSQKVGTSDTVIRNILKERNDPGFEVINKIIQTFDWINARWFITGKGKIDAADDGSLKLPSIEDLIRSIVANEFEKQFQLLADGKKTDVLKLAGNPLLTDSKDMLGGKSEGAAKPMKYKSKESVKAKK